MPYVIGVDINRDARRLATPEGRALKSLHDRLKQEFGFNLHDQGARTRAGPRGPQAAIALLAPPFDAEGGYDPVGEIVDVDEPNPDVVERPVRHAALVSEAHLLAARRGSAGELRGQRAHAGVLRRCDAHHQEAFRLTSTYR